MNKDIKICHLTSAHPSDDVRIFHKECSSIAKAGFSTFLVVDNCTEETINGVQIVSSNAVSKGRFSRFLKTSKSVYQKGLSLDADIYHFHDPELLPYALKLKRKGKIVIYDVHEDVPKTILAKFWINKYLRKTVAFLFKSYEDFVAKRLDYIFTATPHIRERFLLLNANTVDINNYPLLSELAEQTAWDQKKNEICYIGAISSIRGIDQLLSSLTFTSDVTLNLAGTFDQSSLENEMKAHKNWEKVHFFGHVNRHQVLEIMSSSKIGVVTFLPVPNHIDAQPNKMFEYMSAGIPVVGSNFELWKEILEKNKCGICVNPTAPEEISKAINELIVKNELAQEMGQNGRKAVLEKYNWSVEEQKMLSIYQKLLQK